MNRAATLLGLIALILAMPAAEQSTRRTVLTANGDVHQPYVLSSAEFAKLPHVTVRATGHDNKLSSFDGVLIADLLRKAGLKFGAEMRGARVAYAVVAGASDGYRAVFAVAEL